MKTRFFDGAKKIVRLSFTMMFVFTVLFFVLVLPVAGTYGIVEGVNETNVEVELDAVYSNDDVSVNVDSIYQHDDLTSDDVSIVEQANTGDNVEVEENATEVFDTSQTVGVIENGTVYVYSVEYPPENLIGDLMIGIGLSVLIGLLLLVFGVVLNAEYEFFYPNVYP